LEFTIYSEPEPDDPEEIIEGCIGARRVLLSGFKGNPEVDQTKWNEANHPTSVAISLAGEPTLYSRISSLLREFQRRGMTTFLVTNGTRPDRLQTLEVEPTNLYISLCAPDRETYHYVHNPLVTNGWEKLNESLNLMKSFNCRKIIRLTLINGLNMKNYENYAKLILKAEPDYVEPKGFMHIGEARERLPRSGMPTFQEITDFAEKLSKKINYHLKYSSPESRVVLLSKL
jgi:tRNA wybutosine-synthesizing protein 1